MNGATSFMPLTWLFNRLADRRTHLLGLLRHMTALGTRGAMAPKVFGKFLNLLDQISAERTQEARLLDRIAEIEAGHRRRRQQGRLVSAATLAQGEFALPEPSPELTGDKTAQRKRLFWLALLGLALRQRVK